MQKIINFFKSCPEVLKLLLFLFFGTCLVFFTNNLFSYFSPFIIAYLITRILHPLMVKINNTIKLPKIINTLLCLLIFVLIVAFVIGILGYYILDGIEYLIGILSSETTTNKVTELINIGKEQIAVWTEFLNIEINLDTIKANIFDIGASLIKVLSNMSINMVMSMPNILISFIIGAIASFYMLYDYDKIARFLNKQLSPKTREFLRVFNNDVITSLFKMVFSYVLISLVCFIELGIGFWVLNIKDAWFLALLIAIADVLPVIGSGGFLVPGGIMFLLMGDPVRGIGLMVLWGIIVVVRQIVEPKIVGSQIGLYPLITIMALYLGLKFMGAMGLIMGPLYIIICKRLNESKLIHLYSKDDDIIVEHAKNAKQKNQRK